VGSTTADNSTGFGAKFTVGVSAEYISPEEGVFQTQTQTTRYITANSASWPPAVGTKVNAANATQNVASSGYVLSANSTEIIVGYTDTQFANASIVTVLVTSDPTVNATVNTSSNSTTANISATVVSTGSNFVTSVFYPNDFYSTVSPPLEGVNAFMDNSTITGLNVGATADIAYDVGEPNTVNQSTLYRGRVYGWSVDGLYGSILLKRLAFNLNFLEGIQVRGKTSGATANVVVAEPITASISIGLNADITATAGSANGIIAEARVVDSGIGYENGEIVTLWNSSNEFVATALVSLIKQGTGTGEFRNRESLLNLSYLHDSNYYQEYSYEVQTGISLDKYSNVLKKVVHTAGTKFFGNVRKKMEGSMSVSIANSEISSS
jgi:hypothetical protein